MKTKLLGSAVLATTFVMSLSSAVAMTPPNSTTARACLNQVCNTDTAGTSIDGGGFRSKASVDGYTLHSYSDYTDYIDMYSMVKVAAVTVEKFMPTRSSGTSGHAEVYQNFSALTDGSGQVNFAWDGSLFSNGKGLTAGFSFEGEVFRNGVEVESFLFDGKKPGGPDTVNNTTSINILFNQGDTISVRASLGTYVNRFNGITICGPEQICVLTSLASQLNENDRNVFGPSAIADFSNTGSFNIVGSGLQAVPVPAAVWFLGSALLGLAGFSRKKAAA